MIAHPRSCSSTVFALLAGTLLLGTVHAAFTPFETFEGLNLGALGGQNGWTSNSSTYTVGIDPAGGSNQVGVIGDPASTASLYKSLNLADGTTGTLFFRLRRDNVWNASFGMTDVGTPATGNFGDFESQLNFNRNEAGGTATYTRFNDASAAGGTFRNIDSVTGNATQDFDVALDTWYNFWVVIDSATNTSNTWASADGQLSPDFQLLREDNGEGDFVFRNGATNANDLVNFLVIISTAQTGNAYIDDIYFDAAGMNLTNPIPEPSTLMILSVGCLGMLVSRRRRPA